MSEEVDSEKSWREYRRLILSELESLNKAIEGLNRKIDDLRNEEISVLKVNVAMLQLKCSLWGALGGAVSALAAVLPIVLKH